MTQKNQKTRFQKVKAQDGERRCLVTSLPLERAKLIRFALSPDKLVCPDLNEKLGGRGVWVTADKSILQTAIDKKLFNTKGFGAGTKVPADLVEIVERALKKRALDLLGLANKAGLVVSGFSKIKEAAHNEEFAFIIQASDGSLAEEERLRVFLPKEVKVFSVLTKDEMGAEMGKDESVHLAIKKSQMTAKLEQEWERLNAFLNQGQKDE